MRGLLRQIDGVNAHIDRATATPLGGGVSSDIYRVDVDGRTLCVKRALAKLKVAADWRVPVHRNANEAAWLRTAGAIVPGAVPRVLAEDAQAQAFAMEWLPPERYPTWKEQLRDGLTDTDTARRVGEALGSIHARTAGREDVSARFDTGTLFHAIRLEPYLLATAHAHPALAARLGALVERTAGTRLSLVHGDFSPKNLLIGPDGPVIVDAECAWFGDPAFDLAFVLNHLLLKGAWRPQWRSRYLDLYADLVEAYRDHVTWERWPTLEHRTATLLPALLLARVDGKSPVEYLDDDGRRQTRDAAVRLIQGDVPSLPEIAARWSDD